MTTQLYLDYLDNALSRYAVDELVKIWYDSAYLGKLGKTLRRKIREAIPSLYDVFGIEHPYYYSFRGFVEETTKRYIIPLCYR